VKFSIVYQPFYAFDRLLVGAGTSMDQVCCDSKICSAQELDHLPENCMSGAHIFALAQTKGLLLVSPNVWSAFSIIALFLAVNLRIPDAKQIRSPLRRFSRFRTNFGCHNFSGHFVPFVLK
jgi:hypothetical protein